MLEKRIADTHFPMGATESAQATEPEPALTLAELAFREAKVYECDVCTSAYKKIAKDGTPVPGCPACATMGFDEVQAAWIKGIVNARAKKIEAEIAEIKTTMSTIVRTANETVAQLQRQLDRR